jgi:hypothetical protein
MYFTKRYGEKLEPVMMPKVLHQSEEMILTTARIECSLADGSQSTGTGFFFHFPRPNDLVIQMLITNKHVIEDSVSLMLRINTRTADGESDPKDRIELNVDAKAKDWVLHPDASVDLAALPIAPILSLFDKAGRQPNFITTSPAMIPNADETGEFGAIENVVVVGYPIGLWDSTNNLPIVRSGITATHPAVDFLGRQEFLVDAACFVGSSGSPVFLYNPHGWLSRSGVRHLDQSQVRLLGIVYAVARHTEKGEIRMEKAPTKINLVAETEVPTNTAYVIKASRLLEFDAVFREMEAKIAASSERA